MKQICETCRYYVDEYKEEEKEGRKKTRENLEVIVRKTLAQVGFEPTSVHGNLLPVMNYTCRCRTDYATTTLLGSLTSCLHMVE